MLFASSLKTGIHTNDSAWCQPASQPLVEKEDKNCVGSFSTPYTRAPCFALQVMDTRSWQCLVDGIACSTDNHRSHTGGQQRAIEGTPSMPHVSEQGAMGELLGGQLQGGLRGHKRLFVGQRVEGWSPQQVTQVCSYLT